MPSMSYTATYDAAGNRVTMDRDGAPTLYAYDDADQLLSPDPIGDAGGWPVYGYVGGGPVGAVDPAGLHSWYAGLSGVDSLFAAFAGVAALAAGIALLVNAAADLVAMLTMVAVVLTWTSLLIGLVHAAVAILRAIHCTFLAMSYCRQGIPGCCQSGLCDDALLEAGVASTGFLASGPGAYLGGAFGSIHGQKVLHDTEQAIHDVLLATRGLGLSAFLHFAGTSTVSCPCDPLVRYMNHAFV
jgi:hypothetical protein